MQYIYRSQVSVMFQGMKKGAHRGVSPFPVMSAYINFVTMPL